jgi:isopenicillin-N N-acyltransferase-like protein
MPQSPYVLPLVTLRGTPFEIGHAFGRQARSRILLHLENQKAVVAAARPHDPEWWRRAVRAYLEPFETFAPHVVEEMHGLAYGAGLAIEEVLLLNVRDELVTSRAVTVPDACTSFGCHGSVTGDGRPLLGQTKDTAAISQDLYVVTATYQRGRPDLLQMPYAGEVGVFGVSSAGMSAFGNSIYVRGNAQGRMPWTLFRRLALEAESVDEVIGLVERHGVATAGNLTIGDATGRVVAVENIDQGHGIVEAQDGMLVHANHIDTPELRSQEEYPEPERSGSHRRQRRLRELLDAERGRLTAPLAMRCLMDHADFPGSICRHASFPGDIQTTAALIVEPAAGLLHVTRGQPCRGWTATYSLERGRGELS